MSLSAIVWRAREVATVLCSPIFAKPILFLLSVALSVTAILLDMPQMLCWGIAIGFVSAILEEDGLMWVDNVVEHQLGLCQRQRDLEAEKESAKVGGDAKGLVVPVSVPCGGQLLRPVDKSEELLLRASQQEDA